MLRANFHTHTTLCDGEDTPEAVAGEAMRKGFTHLGFSGHMDPDIHMDMDEYTRRISALQKQYQGKMDILMGIELDTMYDPEYAERAEYVIGSTHFPDVECNRGFDHAGEKKRTDRPLSVDASPEDMQLLADTYFGGDFYRLAKSYYETEAQVYDRLHCTFIGHFDLIVRFNDQMHFLDESDPRYTGPALEAMEYLVGEGVPFEINCGAVNRGRRKEFYPNNELLRHLGEMGGRILINSDAHRKELLDGAFGQAVTAAIACGFTHTGILEHGRDGEVRLRELPLDTLL